MNSGAASSPAHSPSSRRLTGAHRSTAGPHWTSSDVTEPNPVGRDSSKTLELPAATRTSPACATPFSSSSSISKMSASLDLFPDEIIQQILEYVPPEDTLRHFQLVSRRSCRIANEPFLWRYYCTTVFEYWSPAHNIGEKLRSKDKKVDWKALFISRKRVNARVAKLLDDILASRVRRYQKIEQICQLGYDAKDFLLQQCRVGDDADDVLARRFFSNAALDSIHRSVALKEWGQRPPINEEVPSRNELAMGYKKKRLERLLGAFDMFFIQQDEGDIDWISKELDILAKIFLRQHPGFRQKHIREKALLLNTWLRMYDFTGMSDPTLYRRLGNCLIGHALFEPQHSSLPVISTAIFVSLAHRLDIPAAPCAFPSHVHAIVSRTTAEGLDGPTTTPWEDDADLMMYVDPYGSDHEVSRDDLRRTLIERGWDGAAAIVHMEPTPDDVIALRVAQNIRASCTSGTAWMNHNQIQQQYGGGAPGISSSSGGVEANPFFELAYGRGKPARSPAAMREMAVYAALWSALLLVRVDERHDWTDLLLGVLSMVTSDWPEDVWLVERYLAPLFDRHRRSFQLHNHRIDSDFGDVWTWCMRVRQVDRKPVAAQRRDDLTRTRVRYRIGDVIKHRRYGFVGIVIAWSFGTAPDEDERLLGWEAGNASYFEMVPYYSCLRDDDTPKFVGKEENIVRIADPDEVPVALFRTAGRYFKRFDRERCVFVSNMREMYPDD